MIDLSELSVQPMLQIVGTEAVIVKHVFLYIIKRLDC